MENKNNDSTEQYLTWLVSLVNNEEFSMEIMSIINRENNTDTLKLMTKRLIEESNVIDDLMKEASSNEEIDGLIIDKNNVKEKMKIIKNIINSYNERVQHEKMLETFGCAGVLFATNDYGNVIVKNHLKQIKANCTKEVYQSFISLIEKLVNGYSEFNQEKQKPLSNNGELKELYALKDYQSRIIYRYVGDYRVIIGATIKKDDFAEKYRKFYINCKKQSNNFINSLSNNLSNEEELQDLIDKSREFYDTIISENGGLKR